MRKLFGSPMKRKGDATMENRNGSKLTAYLAFIAVLALAVVSFFGANAANATGTDNVSVTTAWTGNGSDNANPGCATGQTANWHWIWTPGGNVDLVSGTLTVHYASGATTTTDGVFNGNGGGAMHFYVTRPSNDTVTLASVSGTATGEGNFVLTISSSSCTGGPPPPVCTAPQVLTNGVCVTPPPVKTFAYSNASASTSCTGTTGTTGTITATDTYTATGSPQFTHVIQLDGEMAPPQIGTITDGAPHTDTRTFTNVAAGVHTVHFLSSTGNADVSQTVTVDCTPPPVCTAPQVLTNGVCVTPPPVCTAPQVLTNGVCVTPPPVCTAPQVLTNGVCVTPPPDATATVTVACLGTTPVVTAQGHGLRPGNSVRGQVTTSNGQALLPLASGTVDANGDVTLVVNITDATSINGATFRIATPTGVTLVAAQAIPTIVCTQTPPPVDVCTNIEGNQATVPTGYTVTNGVCTQTPPPVDVCTNIEGNQATVPTGYTVTNGVCTQTVVVVTPPVVVPPVVVVPPAAKPVTGSTPIRAIGAPTDMGPSTNSNIRLDLLIGAGSLLILAGAGATTRELAKRRS
jgi:hypothetical protein